jgi:hypothetical protein
LWKENKVASQCSGNKINREYLLIILKKKGIINISSSIVIIICFSRDSSANRATGYGLDGQDSLIHNVQTDSRVHPASYTMGTGAKAART